MDIQDLKKSRFAAVAVPFGFEVSESESAVSDFIRGFCGVGSLLTLRDSPASQGRVRGMVERREVEGRWRRELRDGYFPFRLVDLYGFFEIHTGLLSSIFTTLLCLRQSDSMAVRRHQHHAIPHACICAITRTLDDSNGLFRDTDSRFRVTSVSKPSKPYLSIMEVTWEG